MSETSTRTRLAILTLATCVALSTTGSSTVPARAAAHHARHCRPRAGEHVQRRFAHLVVLENGRSKAIACVRSTGHRETMVRGRFYDGTFLLGVDFLTGVRRTAGTIIAYNISLEDDTQQTRVLDAATGDRVLLSTLNIVGSDTARMLLKRDGTFAATLGISSRDGKPGTIQVVICGVASCTRPSDHLAADDPNIDPFSLRREDDQACWTRTDPTLPQQTTSPPTAPVPQKECAPLSAD